MTARRSGNAATAATAMLAALFALPCGGCVAHRLGAAAVLLPESGTRLPGQLDRGIWQLQVTLPGIPTPKTFLLDTGTDRTLIDLRLAHQLGLTSTGDEVVVTATGGSVAAHALDRLPWLRLGDAHFDSVDVVGLDLGPLQEHGGLRIDGIAGCDLFRGCLLEIDYRDRRVRLLPRTAAPATPCQHFDDRCPHVAADIAGTNLELLVDTGFQQALALGPEVVLPWRVAPRRDGEIATLDGTTAKSTARLQGTVAIGDVTWRDPWVVVVPGAPKLGTALLRFCRLVVDSEGGRVWLDRGR